MKSNGIKWLREDRGYTRKKMADEFHKQFPNEKLDRHDLHRWETGASYPRFEMLWLLADFFETSVDEVMGREVVVEL